MENFINYAPLVTGVFLIFVALVQQTKNFISSFIYKVLPFLFGVSCIFSSVKLLGWI